MKYNPKGSLFDLFDHAYANELGVTLEEYIERIENTTDERGYLIIAGLSSEDLKKREQAKRCFFMIKPPNHKLN